MSTVVLVSGGLDSYIAWRLAPSDKKAVWVHLGQPYADKERGAIVRARIPAIEVKVDNMFPLPITIENSEIPGRNLLLAFAGAQHGDTVWLSALEGEMHLWTRDKTIEFFHMTTALFTFIFNCVRPETRVITPFQRLTKTEIVELALGKGITKEELLATSSCYHPTLRNCGICGTCYKRWIAMVNNGVEEIYANPPWLSEYAKRTRGEMHEALRSKDFSHYSEKRIHETQAALAEIGEVL